MITYLVFIEDVASREVIQTTCQNKGELATLLSNIDDARYRVGQIISQDNTRAVPYTIFCKPPGNLETGKEKEIVPND